MGIFGDVVSAVTSIPKSVASATTGKHGLLGSKGFFGLATHGKFLRAAQATGAAVGQVVDNRAIQSAFPQVFVPASIVAGAAKGGPKGALSAVKRAAENPLIKAELAAVAVVFPPLAPASAAGIAAMEATSRIIDASRSGDPKKIATAAVQIAATQLAARAGNADAERALALMRDVNAARKLADGADPHTLDALKAAAKAGDTKAKNRLVVVQHQAIREAHKESVSAKPELRAQGRARLVAAQKNAPGLIAGTIAALNSPKGVRVGEFALLRTGRILHRGKPIRSGHLPTPKKPPLKAAGRK